jgi:hydroxypyruvate reductase
VAAALADNDSYPLLDGLGALVRSGPTGTNVGDLQVLLLP